MTKPKPKLTMDLLKQAMEPPNNCRVKPFRDSMDEESRAILDEALKVDAKDLPASAIRKMLVDGGYDEELIPVEGAFQDHRNGSRPCRCRG